jgi:hypothetical protein
MSSSNANSGIIIAASVEDCFYGDCDGQIGTSIMTGAAVLFLIDLVFSEGLTDLSLYALGALVLSEENENKLAVLYNESFPFIEDQSVIDDLVSETSNTIKAEDIDLKNVKGSVEVFLKAERVADILERADLSQKDSDFVLKALSR